MQGANPFVHLIEQLAGPGRNPVRFVGSVIPVQEYSIRLYAVDFKTLLGVPCDFV